MRHAAVGLRSNVDHFRGSLMCTQTIRYRSVLAFHHTEMQLPPRSGIEPVYTFTEPPLRVNPTTMTKAHLQAHRFQ